MVLSASDSPRAFRANATHPSPPLRERSSSTKSVQNLRRYAARHGLPEAPPARIRPGAPNAGASRPPRAPRCDAPRPAMLLSGSPGSLIRACSSRLIARTCRSTTGIPARAAFSPLILASSSGFMNSSTCCEGSSNERLLIHTSLRVDTYMARQRYMAYEVDQRILVSLRDP